MLKNIWHPERYHGFGEKTLFFEGWYYKLVTRDKSRIYAVIPGVFIDPGGGGDQSFIQIIRAPGHETYFYRFSRKEFVAETKRFDFRIGPNYFSGDRMKLALDNGALRVNGSLEFNRSYPWPVSLMAPGAMGWYAFMPFMQCYHAVPSLYHTVEGKLVAGDEEVDFSGGTGYVEKDWGREFPSAYVWMQCNHFSPEGTSLMVSVAKIPWRSGSFRGFLAGLLLEGRFYRLTTYTGAVIEELNVDNSKIHVIISDKNHRLEIEAERSETGLLYGPSGKTFEQNVAESLTGTISIKFYHRKRGRFILFYEDRAYPAAIEVNGDPGEIMI